MKRSDSRILTTHTGSLPRPPDLVALLNKKELGEPYDRGAFDARIARAIAEVVRRRPTPASTSSTTASTARSTGWPMRGRGCPGSRRSTRR